MATAAKQRRRLYHSGLAGVVPILDLPRLMQASDLLNMKITALISSMATVAAGLGAGVAIAAQGPDASRAAVDLFDNWRLVGFCVVGSVCGAFLSLAVFTPDTTGEPADVIRRLMAKFGTSILSGFTFSPGILSYWRDTFAPHGGLPTPSIVLSVSGLVATIFVWLIHKFGPIAVEYARQRWGRQRRRR